LNAEPPHRPGDRSAPEEGYDIELAPVGLLVAASDGHVIATNQAWSELSNGSLPALSGLSILTHKNKKRGNTLNFNPNGASDVTVDLENNRPPANVLERLLRTWPEMDRS
jgi:hypothetical protein